ncbi:hypothetical protein [Nocardioides sp. YIM 152315]|uniref:hypothetical protein n=1 Tax=Nocardioides sp. YIM 152315 TaxID=3031760 RepID=UPI0023DCD8B6|nr:hypothetical protein [Nocardioides sp. YIM 152315]MDF1603930.1 hypothetical protein [Nocardioides sp. YIM 152315]
MSLGVRHDERDGARRAGGRDVVSVPRATRTSAPGWRDPRLWIGLLIVAVSVVAGARLLAAADDTVQVWAVRADAGPGAELTEADLVARRVRFADSDDLETYYRVDAALPGGLRLVRGVGEGELLPRGAVGADDALTDTVELPVAVEAEQAPPTVAAGSVVDVYLVGSPGREAADDRALEPGKPVLREATVVDAPAVDAGFGGAAGRRQLVLAVPQEAAAAYFAAVAELETPALTVVRRG